MSLMALLGVIILVFGVLAFIPCYCMIGTGYALIKWHLWKAAWDRREEGAPTRWYVRLVEAFFFPQAALAGYVGDRLNAQECARALSSDYYSVELPRLAVVYHVFRVDRSDVHAVTWFQEHALFWPIAMVGQALIIVIACIVWSIRLMQRLLATALSGYFSPLKRCRCL